MRKNNIELVRILCMYFIISSHFFIKGNILPDVTKQMGTNDYLLWFMEIFCYISVNLFVLISGFFSSKKSARIDKIWNMWIQILFYSLVIGFGAMICGIQPVDKYAVLELIFPISTEQYWFMTAFFLVSLLAPILQHGVETMEQKTFIQLLSGLIILNSVAKSILPMKLPLDQSGYDFLWLLCVYLTGMYLKKFGIPNLLQRRIRSGIVFLISVFAVYGSMLFIRFIYLKTGKYMDFITYSYSYNYIFCYLGSIACFSYFLQGREYYPVIGKLVNKMGGATLGVYIIHEHRNLRYMWPQLFSPEKVIQLSPVLFIPAVILIVTGVFVFCALIELGRQKLFALIKHN